MKKQISAQHLNPGDVVEGYGTVANVEDFTDFVEVSFWDLEYGTVLWEFEENEKVSVIAE
jgi:hypothetical protein